MRTLLLASLFALAMPAAAQPIYPYDISFPREVAISVIDWNGQPALLLWSRYSAFCAFEGPGTFQRVALATQLTMAVDSRACAVGSSVGYNTSGYGHWPVGRMPSGGVLFSSRTVDLRNQYATLRVWPTNYEVDYCPTTFCDGCWPYGQFDRPEMWAAICTVRLL